MIVRNIDYSVPEMSCDEPIYSLVQSSKDYFLLVNHFYTTFNEEIIYVSGLNFYFNFFWQITNYRKKRRGALTRGAGTPFPRNWVRKKIGYCLKITVYCRFILDVPTVFLYYHPTSIQLNDFLLLSVIELLIFCCRQCILL